MPTRIIAKTPPRLDADLIARFAAVPVAVVVDLLEGRTQVDPAIRPLRRIAGGPTLLGSAVTAVCDPRITAPCTTPSRWRRPATWW